MDVPAVLEAPPAPPAPAPWLPGRPRLGLVLRWGFIAAVTVAAFRSSLEVLIISTLSAGVNGYVWVIPFAGMMAAYGVARRERGERSINDRQTDVIVGVMGLSLAVMVQGVLLPRYTDFFSLLRLDLVALLLFVVSSGVMLFGLRAVARYRSVWALMLIGLPLPYHLMVILLGGGRLAAGVTPLLIVGAAATIAFGHDRIGAILGAIGAWGIGVAYLVGLWLFLPDAALLVYQLNPSLTAIGLLSVWMFVTARREPSRDRSARTEVLAANEIRWGAVVVVVAGLVLAVLPFPPGARPQILPQFDGLSLGSTLVPPRGWHVVETSSYGFVKRLYGRDATMVRQKLVADVGNPEWDKLGRPRTVVVDAATTAWRRSLEVYPPPLLFNVSQRVSRRIPVGLGYGVVGDLLTAVDDRLLLTWNVLEFEWRNGVIAQRVTVVSVNNHEPDALFPPPNGGIWMTLNELLAVLFRGNAVTIDERSSFEDADLLTVFGRGLVEAQFRSAAGRQAQAPR